MITDNSVYGASTFEDKGRLDRRPAVYGANGVELPDRPRTRQPVDDAQTHFTVPQDGTYNLFVRTRNWTAFWSDKPTPGVFRIRIDDREVETPFGDGAANGTGRQASRFLSKGPIPAR